MRAAAALAAATGRLWTAGREGVRDARAAWSRRATSFLLAYVAVAVAAPLLLPPAALRDAASGLYVALAAVGLNYAVGLGGMASLGQGAFVGAGAFAVALLTSRAGWAPGPATLAGAGAGLAAGVLAGAGTIRLRGPFVAVATWIVSWMFAFGLAAFPGVFGGAQGVRVGRPPGPGGALPGGELTPAGHFEVGLALVALAAIGFAVLRRGPMGLGLSAARQSSGAAHAIGIEPGRWRLAAFAASAAIGGLAGGLSVQLAGVADAGDYGPLLSVKLFVAVLIGGERFALGPVGGAAVLAAIGPLSRALGNLTGAAASRLEGVVAAVLLVVALVGGRSGLAGAVRRLRRGAGVRGIEGSPAPEAASPGPRQTPGATVLQIEGVSKWFGGLSALHGVSFDVRAGRIHALVGPNGSGKTTLLRILGGTLRPDAGVVRLAGDDVTRTGVRERVRLGLVRTLQRTAVFPDLRALDHVVAGASALRRTGAVRAMLATPDARSEARALRARGLDALARTGLAGRAGELVAELSGADQRMLSIATALAARPRVLLLDEPAAGMDSAAREHLGRLLTGLRDDGVAVVLVEHDLRLVRVVADTITVLDAGAVIASGAPVAVARHREVRRAYLGPGARSRDLSGGGRETTIQADAPPSIRAREDG